MRQKVEIFCGFGDVINETVFVCVQVIAVSYAIMTTRDEDLDWKLRSFRILPMFLLPALAFLTYSSLVSFTRMCESLCSFSFICLFSFERLKLWCWVCCFDRVCV